MKGGKIFQQGRSVCRVFGGDLVKVSSAEEQAAVCKATGTEKKRFFSCFNEKRGKNIFDLENQIKKGEVPNHLAVIMDGNRRYAEGAGLLPHEGHLKGKNTLENSLGCLKMRGTMVSFGNASGKLDPVDVGKLIAPKGLYLTRPSIAHYTSTREELDEASNKLFEMVKSGAVKVEIFKKYALKDASIAHQDLEGRRILGPAIITP